MRPPRHRALNQRILEEPGRWKPRRIRSAYPSLPPTGTLATLSGVLACATARAPACRRLPGQPQVHFQGSAGRVRRVPGGRDRHPVREANDSVAKACPAGGSWCGRRWRPGSSEENAIIATAPCTAPPAAPVHPRPGRRPLAVRNSAPPPWWREPACTLRVHDPGHRPVPGAVSHNAGPA